MRASGSISERRVSGRKRSALAIGCAAAAIWIGGACSSVGRAGSGTGGATGTGGGSSEIGGMYGTGGTGSGGLTGAGGTASDAAVERSDASCFRLKSNPDKCADRYDDQASLPLPLCATLSQVVITTCGRYKVVQRSVPSDYGLTCYYDATGVLQTSRDCTSTHPYCGGTAFCEIAGGTLDPECDRYFSPTSADAGCTAATDGGDDDADASAAGD